MASTIDEAIVKMRKAVAAQTRLDAESEECKTAKARMTGTADWGSRAVLLFTVRTVNERGHRERPTLNAQLCPPR